MYYKTLKYKDMLVEFDLIEIYKFKAYVYLNNHIIATIPMSKYKLKASRKYMIADREYIWFDLIEKE